MNQKQAQHLGTKKLRLTIRFSEKTQQSNRLLIDKSIDFRVKNQAQVEQLFEIMNNALSEMLSETI